MSELVRYFATGGGTVTLCSALAYVISLRMRLKFSRYVVDKAVEQGQPIDPVEIINAATPKDAASRLKRSRRNTPRSVKRALAKPVEPPALPLPNSGHTGLCSR
jgi:hypothetical protein